MTAFDAWFTAPWLSNYITPWPVLVRVFKQQLWQLWDEFGITSRELYNCFTIVQCLKIGKVHLSRRWNTWRPYMPNMLNTETWMPFSAASKSWMALGLTIAGPVKSLCQTLHPWNHTPVLLPEMPLGSIQEIKKETHGKQPSQTSIRTVGFSYRPIEK